MNDKEKLVTIEQVKSGIKTVLCAAHCPHLKNDCGCCSVFIRQNEFIDYLENKAIVNSIEKENHADNL